MLRAAKTWGIVPSAIGLCGPEDDLAYMVAYVRAESAMQAVEAEDTKR